MDFAEGTTDSTCKDPCLKSQERIKFEFKYFLKKRAVHNNNKPAEPTTFSPKFEIMVNFGYHTTNHMYAIKSYFPSINFLDYTLT